MLAALFDIHANLPALDAVLREVAAERVDHIVVGGDAIPGPMPGETLARLRDLRVPTHFIYGNGERAVLAQMTARHPSEVTYWGSASGKPIPEPHQEVLRWTARQLSADHRRILESWPMTVRLDIPGVGQVLFCHSTPRSETEIFTRRTSEDRLLPIFSAVDAVAVVCGHSHMQFDRMIGRTRVVNAGSVGMPFGPPGADWLMIDGPVFSLRHTMYDLNEAADRVRRTDYPMAADFAANNILKPPTEEQILAAFAHAELTA